MKIPQTIPKIILRAYARELTEEQLKAQYEGRLLRSEDSTWDEVRQATLADQCLNMIIDEYPFYVQLVEESNKDNLKKYEAAEEKWREDLAKYKKRRMSYDRKMLAQDFRLARDSIANADDDDDDDDDQAFVQRVLQPPEPVPESFDPYIPLKPVLDQLNDTDRTEAIEELDTKKVPLPMAMTTIPDAYYWERAVQEKWPYLFKDNHGGNWRQAYMEKFLWENIESFHPFEGDLKELLEKVELFAPFVRQLTLINLIPNCFGVESRPKIFKPFLPDEELTGEDDGFPAIAELKKAAEMQKRAEAEDEQDDEDKDKVIRDNSHIDLSTIIPHLRFLKKFCIIYEMQEMGMDWEARFFDFTDKDVENLAKTLTLAPSLEHFELNKSRMTDEQTKILVRDGLMKMANLKVLNISYNNIGNAGARAIARLLIDRRARNTLHTLSMARNNIKNKGAKAIAYALTINSHLIILDMRLNYIGDPGGKNFGHALVKNETLLSISLAGNRLTEESAYILGKMLQHNTTLKELDVSSNSIGKKGGEYLAMGVRANKGILKMDIRLADATFEFEYDVDAHLKKNRNRLPYSLLDRDDIYPPETNNEFEEFDMEEYDLEGGDDDEEEEDEMTTILAATKRDDVESQHELGVDPKKLRKSRFKM